MLLVQLTLQTQTPIALIPQEQIFLGGVFHGWFEAIVSHTSPGLWKTLRGIKNQSARYALRVPATQNFNPAQNTQMLGLMLFEPVQHLWPEILETLNHTRPFNLGHARTPIHIVNQQFLRPDCHDITFLHAHTQQGAQQLAAPVEPPYTTEVHGLTIQLQAPTLINSQARRNRQNNSHPPHALPMPFSLSSIIGSLQRRTTELEPTLAAHYGFDTPAWHDAVRQTWPHQHPVDCQIEQTNWPYASRNTPGRRPVLIHAISGSMYYKGLIPAPVVSLLEIGQWIGIGQKNSLGMGWYTLQANDVYTRPKQD